MEVFEIMKKEKKEE
jgi:SPX domain protein involved in polyphosphate accumulation